jgi:hypothetical protein
VIADSSDTSYTIGGILRLGWFATLRCERCPAGVRRALHGRLQASYGAVCGHGDGTRGSGCTV